MKLNPDDLAHLSAFIGYGRLDAPIWFVGMEEGLGGNESALEGNLSVRLGWSARVMDMAEAHDAHNLNGPYFETGRVPTVWLFMARIARALGREQAADWQADREAARAYVRDSLGRSNGETLLAELLPLPRVNVHSWPEAYRGLFPTAREYVASVLPQRIAMLGELVRTHRPRLLICYGSSHRGHYRRIVGAAEWACLAGTQIEVTRRANTTAALMPFFGNGRLSLNDLGVLITYLRSEDR
jgi:hypothetical protein